MRRVVAGSLIAFFLLIIAAIGIYYSQKYAVIPADPVNAIPSDAAFYLELPSGKKGSDALLKSEFFKLIARDTQFYSFRKDIRYADSLFNTERLSAELWGKQKILISAHPTTANDFDYLYLLNLPRGKSESPVISLASNLLPDDAIDNRRVYENVIIHEYMKDRETIITFAVSNGILMVSHTPFLVEDAIRQLKTGVSPKKSKAFARVNVGKTNTNDYYIYINYLGFHDLLLNYIDPAKRSFHNALNNIARWSRMTLNYDNRSLRFTGLSSTLDTNDLLPAFRGQKAIRGKISGIAPARTAMIVCLTSDSINNALARLRRNGIFFPSPVTITARVDSLRKKTKINFTKSMYQWASDEIALIVTEPGSEVLDNNSYACVHANNITKALSSLNEISKRSGKGSIEKYRGHTLGYININSLVPIFFGSIFNDITQCYYSNAGEFIIFSSTAASMKSFLDDIEENRLLSSEPGYHSNEQDSMMNGNVNIYFDFHKGQNILRSFGNSSMYSMLMQQKNAWNALSIFRLSLTNNLTVYSTRATVTAGKDVSQDIHLLWSTQLDTSCSGPPFLVHPVNTDRPYITIQDAGNNLYFFDYSGRLKWKKPLGEKILSDILTVDYYRNGQTQILFNTSSFLYLLSLSGEDVGNFPIKLPAPASNGCTVADVDSNHNYRIFVACTNGMIYSYEISGKPSPEWMFNHFIQGITSSFQAMRISDEFYILFIDENGILQLCDRRGKIYRVKAPKAIEGKALIAYTDTFHRPNFVLNTPGGLTTIDAILHVPVVPDEDRMLAEDFTVLHRIDDDDLILLRTENTITTSTPFQEESENYSIATEMIFSRCVSSPYFSGLSDSTADKFILLNNNGKPESSFPVKGYGDFSIWENRNYPDERKLIVGGKNGFVYMYGIR
jgi:hypothetical protein